MRDMAKINLVQGFFSWKLKFRQFPDGFRLKMLDFYLENGRSLRSCAWKYLQNGRTSSGLPFWNIFQYCLVKIPKLEAPYFYHFAKNSNQIKSNQNLYSYMMTFKAY